MIAGRRSAAAGRVCRNQDTTVDGLAALVWVMNRGGFDVGCRTQISIAPFWLTSPLLLALVGLLGTGVGAVLQGFWNTRLEREKFEFSLIEKALAVADKKEAAQNLKFLVDAGLINQFSAEKIAALARNPQSLPDFAAPRDVLPPRLGKIVLSRLGTYKGAIDDDNTGGGYRKAIVDFQVSQSLPGDGVIGPLTFDRMRSEYTKAAGIWPPEDTTRPKP